MDDEDLRALASLQDFGRVSLPIHMRRCRSLLPPSEEEEAAAEHNKGTKSIKRKQVQSLVDLCLRFVTKHFESVYMDRILSFPEAEAALIASMPSNLLHRMAKTKNRESRATIETLESTLQGARRDVAQLESARDWAAISRARMAEQQHVSDRLQRELDTIQTALSSTEVENQHLRAKAERAEKQLLRLEAKINSLKAEKVVLKKASTEAHRREMKLSSELLSAQKARLALSVQLGRSIRSRRQSARSGHLQGDAQLSDPSSIGGSSSHEFSENTTSSNAFTQQRHSVTCHKRPRAEGSNIPYPPSMRMEDQH
ncbi:hypothetical protein PC129_g5387 [Phytophthora cactorum]|uniref:Uncharacterized protein n=1 Tax=Phytophthora cactorum TaxID=29920 RepID=A0A8T1IHG4_9STRA|nr:hypothetical protein PC129_g5387 [Phytophthora cactorum]